MIMFKKKINKNRKNDRFEFLKGLIEKFKISSKETTIENEESLELIAHIGNFAYDPINRDYFKRVPFIFFFLIQIFKIKLNIIHEFFDFLNKSDKNHEKLSQTREFIWAGLSNLSVDPCFQPEIITQKQYILASINRNPDKNTQIHLYTILYYISHSQETLEILSRLLTEI